jgi:hypothetical protein
MTEKNVTTNLRYLIGGIGILIMMLLLSVYAGLLQVSTMDRSVTVQEASERPNEKIMYYKNLAGDLQQLQIKEPANADYYARNADCLIEISGIKEKTTPPSISKEIEELYLKALALNPLDFEYHLKLGWFYETSQAQGHQDQLEKTIELYPTDYQGYLYLARHYLRHGDEQKAFANIVLSTYYTGAWGHYKERVVREVTADLPTGSLLQFETNNILSFTMPFQGRELDLKKYGFAHIQPMFFTVRVTAGKNLEKIIVRNNGVQHVVPPTPQDSSAVYELNLSQLYPEGFLDEFTVKVIPEEALEKIQLTQKCYY